VGPKWKASLWEDDIVSTSRENLEQRVMARVGLTNQSKISYDGDALNGIIILDHQMLEALDELAPRNGVYDTRKPRSISSHIAIPAPVVTTISNYIHRGR